MKEKNLKARDREAERKEKSVNYVLETMMLVKRRIKTKIMGNWEQENKRVKR